MKKLLFSLSVFYVLFVIGCQENPITDPRTNESVSKDQGPGPYQHGFIPLEGMLIDPYAVMNSFYIISGEIEYEHRLVSPNYVSLQFITNANFKYFCTVCSPSEQNLFAGFISDYSEEYLLLTDNSVVLEKSFPIQNREDGMMLKCRFLVTESSIELNAMWLALQGDDVVAIHKTNN